MNPKPQLVELRAHNGDLLVTSKRQGEDAKSFLKLCFDNYFSFSQIAQELEVSPTTLRKAFTAYVGISPKAWMTQQRVIHSIRLISGGKSLTEVAEEMVYTDYRHMAKEFRSVVDFTPKTMEKVLRGLQGAGEMPSFPQKEN